MISNARSAISNMVSNIASTASQVPGRIGSAISGAISQVASWGGRMVSTAASAISSMASTIVSIASGIPGQMVSIGANIIGGIASGISGAIGGLYNTIHSQLSGLVDKAKSALGIASPSKVFAKEVGRWIFPGITKGTEASLPKIKDELAGQMKELTSAMHGTVNLEMGRMNVGLAAGSSYGAGGPVSIYNDNHMEQTNTYNVPTATPSEVNRTQRDAFRRLVQGVS